jgi:hypothetical protein
MIVAADTRGVAMDEHERQVAKVADWLADGWDWDGIGAALGLDADEASARFGADAAEHIREMEAQLASGAEPSA